MRSMQIVFVGTVFIPNELNDVNLIDLNGLGGTHLTGYSNEKV